MRRLIFVNRYFFPDHSATSQLLSDLAIHLAATGREVHVVTSTQIYDEPRAALPGADVVDGVRVHRVPSTRFGRSTLPGRSIDYLSFYRSAWHRLRDVARPGDLIVAKTDPPLVSLVAMAAARRSGAGLINWLQDLYPEIGVALGVPLLRGPLAAGLAQLRNRSLRGAEATVAVGRLMAERLEALAVPSARIRVIPNWCNDQEIRPISEAANSLRREWALQGKFVLGYSGNLGRAHEFDTVLAAAERLRGNERIVFLMIGGGKRFDELAGIVKDRGLDQSFRFVAYQERKVLAYSLGVPDVHWLSLQPKLEGLLVPSKFYGIAAAGKPMIVISAKDGELAGLVQEHDCGVVIEPGDVDGLVGTLLRLANDRQALAGMGMRARQMLETHFSRQKAFDRWDELLAQLDEALAEPSRFKFARITRPPDRPAA